MEVRVGNFLLLMSILRPLSWAEAGEANVAATSRMAERLVAAKAIERFMVHLFPVLMIGCGRIIWGLILKTGLVGWR